MFDVEDMFDGTYEASRAAALSGVPISTIYHWARTDLVVPSVSAQRLMLWSYADLVTLRLVHWLRHPKHDFGVPASSLGDVRSALGQLAEANIELWTEDAGSYRSSVYVDGEGRVFVKAHDDSVRRLDGQLGLEGVLDLLGPFDMAHGRGPDLVQPRPHLRIVPGKVAGEPHLEHSRLTTLTIAALSHRGYGLADIARLYPDEDPVALAEAVDLEQQLAA